MDLETVTQSEESQKEKNKYHILTHICEIQNGSTGEPVCKTAVEPQMYRTNQVWTPRREKMWWHELGEWDCHIYIYIYIYIYTTMYKIDN